MSQSIFDNTLPAGSFPISSRLCAQATEGEVVGGGETLVHPINSIIKMQDTRTLIYINA